MRTLRYPLVFAIAAAAIVGLNMVLGDAAVWFKTQVLANRPSPSWGISASLVSSLSAFIYVVITQNRRKPGVVRRYRWAEQRLMEMQRMHRDEILQYHGSYNWHAYAAIGFSTLFIIVPLFLGKQIPLDDPMDVFAMYLGLVLLGLSSVTLGIVDLFHTNTLTPLITIDRRFALMDVVLKLGGGALMLQVCAVGVFLSLVNSWLSVVTSMFSLWLMVFITERRGVPIASLAWERQLNEAEARDVERA